MNIQDKIQQLRQIINQQLSSLVTGDYFFLELPYYENIGDTLIWEGSLNFFKQFKYKCLYSASLQTFYLHRASSSTPIFLQGGGNFGDLWEEHHNFRKHVIELYPSNPITIFPQSTCYESNENLKEDEVFFAKHTNVVMCARDINSFEFMKQHFPHNRVLLVPDMAFFIDFKKYGAKQNLPTERTLFAKRIDKELKDNSWPEQIPQTAEVHDWPTFEFKAKKYQRADYICGWLNFFANIKGIKSFNRLIDFQRNHFYRKEYLKYCVEFLSKYDTVYSTRLHIMIAAAMLGKQVYVIDNTYGKNISIYNTWLKDLDNINPL